MTQLKNSALLLLKSIAICETLYSECRVANSRDQTYSAIFVITHKGVVGIIAFKWFIVFCTY